MTTCPPRLLFAVATLIMIGVICPLAADPPKPNAELANARKMGLELTRVVIERLETDDQTKFPGIETWLKDLNKSTKAIDLKAPVEKWPAFDVDGLMARNPNFWRAYYEIAPGDPGLMLVQAGLLMSAGEMSRASHILVVALQRPGIPENFRRVMLELLANTMKAGEASNAIVREGIERHDKEDYAAAIQKYDEAIAVWPQNSFAHYEIGYTIFTQMRVASGEKPLKDGTVIVNGKDRLPAKTKAAYAKSRLHDPLNSMAYQGGERDIVDGFQVLIGKGLPIWKKLAKDPEKRIDDLSLQAFSEACQDAGIHELGLAVRQVLVARRGRYAPSDHPYSTASLQKLAPGEQTDAVLKRLATGLLNVRQLVAPEKEVKNFVHNQLRLYVPNPDLPKRLGDDVTPMANYIKALDEPLEAWLEKEKPRAKGLFIAIGIRAGKKSRAWCESVEGDIPADALRRLETELGKVPTIELKKEPMAFAMEMILRGQIVKTFPEAPAVWLDALKKSKNKLLVPPDELFKLIWAD